MKTMEILGFKTRVAWTFWERTRGLIGTKSLAPDEGLLIEKCNAIHMCFMSFPIDAYFLVEWAILVAVYGRTRWRRLGLVAFVMNAASYGTGLLMEL